MIAQKSFNLINCMEILLKGQNMHVWIDAPPIVIRSQLPSHPIIYRLSRFGLRGHQSKQNARSQSSFSLTTFSRSSRRIFSPKSPIWVLTWFQLNPEHERKSSANTQVFCTLIFFTVEHFV